MNNRTIQEARDEGFIDPCDTCEYNSLDWHEEPCESCTGEDNHWKPSAQPEVIRCKDCKYGSPNGQYGCKCYHYQLYETHEMYEHDFCSRAERRTE